ncbi:autotransporter outer membrane beta-barrel domain-containing protein [Rickettsia hoogstraalii]|uniref:autotransporter outer membrane beta-barrel domain-containing protein n=1 Tax=Rickettsia hoogstraalii TaxID=467174 RepID=UPI000590DA66|nr:autotransporter outer membrane beta-barrel domain-containing protein [Rickettsia hoogstraalii]
MNKLTEQNLLKKSRFLKYSLLTSISVGAVMAMPVEGMAMNKEAFRTELSKKLSLNKDTTNTPQQIGTVIVPEPERNTYTSSEIREMEISKQSKAFNPLKDIPIEDHYKVVAHSKSDVGKARKARPITRRKAFVGAEKVEQNQNNYNPEPTEQTPQKPEIIITASSPTVSPASNGFVTAPNTPNTTLISPEHYTTAPGTPSSTPATPYQPTLDSKPNDNLGAKTPPNTNSKAVRRLSFSSEPQQTVQPNTQAKPPVPPKPLLLSSAEVAAKMVSNILRVNETLGIKLAEVESTIKNTQGKKNKKPLQQLQKQIVSSQKKIKALKLEAAEIGIKIKALDEENRSLASCNKKTGGVKNKRELDKDSAKVKENNKKIDELQQKLTNKNEEANSLSREIDVSVGGIVLTKPQGKAPVTEMPPAGSFLNQQQQLEVLTQQQKVNAARQAVVDKRRAEANEVRRNSAEYKDLVSEREGVQLEQNQRHIVVEKTKKQQQAEDKQRTEREKKRKEKNHQKEKAKDIVEIREDIAKKMQQISNANTTSNRLQELELKVGAIEDKKQRREAQKQLSKIKKQEKAIKAAADEAQKILNDAKKEASRTKLKKLQEQMGNHVAMVTNDKIEESIKKLEGLVLTPSTTSSTATISKQSLTAKSTMPLSHELQRTLPEDEDGYLEPIKAQPKINKNLELFSELWREDNYDPFLTDLGNQIFKGEQEIQKLEEEKKILEDKVTPNSLKDKPLRRSSSASSLNIFGSNEDLSWDNTGDNIGVGHRYGAEDSCPTPDHSSSKIANSSDKNSSETKLALLQAYQMAVIVKRQELEQLPSTSSGAAQIVQQIEVLREEEVTMHDTINACIADSSKLNDVSFEEINEALKKLGSEIPESAISDFESKAQKDPEAISDGSILQEMLSSKDSLIPESAISDFESKVQKDPEAISDGSILQEMLSSKDSLIPESAISDFESKAQKDPEAISDGSILQEMLSSKDSLIPESAISDFESKAQKDPEAISDGSILQEMLSSKDSLPSGDEEQEDTEVTESGIQKAGDKGLLALPVSSNECALALSDSREKECLALDDGSEDEESYDSGFEEEEEIIEQLSDSDGGNLKITEVDMAIPLEQKAKKEMQTQISENAPTLNQAKVVNTIVNNMIRNRLDASMNMSNNMVAVGAGDEEESRIKRGLWMRGMYGTNNHGRVENMTGYRGTNKGATIGFDVEIDNNILGIAYSNVHSVFKFKNSKNNDKELIDSHVVSIYGQKELPRNFALQALVSASKNFIKDKTTYSYGDTKIRSNVKHRNHSYNAEALLNYNYLLQNKLVITPNIGLRYGKSRDGIYNETGINIQEIALTMKENNILSGIVGTKVKVPLKDVLKFNNLGLTFQGAVEHNFKEKTQRINRVVKIFDNTFKQDYLIPKQPKTSYNLGTGIIGSIKNTTISLDYNYYLNKHYRSHQGSVKLKVNL